MENVANNTKTKQNWSKKVPFKLIGMIITMLIVVCFAGFNIDNRSNVSLIFYTFQNVPVFVTIFCSFSFGILFTLPFTIGRDSARRKVKEAKSQIEALKAENAKYLKENYTKVPKKKHEKNKKDPKLDKLQEENKPNEPVEQNAENKTNDTNQEQMLSNVGYF